jgi:DNA-binding response OmpR family regulator/predicted regulator of Ras-like GTPase activity (Roadblock/LC7/MglB family)
MINGHLQERVIKNTARPLSMHENRAVQGISQEMPQVSESNGTVTPRMGPSHRERILLVAKDDLLRAQLIDTLETGGGYLTYQASNFEEALSEILLTDFDLIVTEAELPDLSGMDLLAVVGGLRPNASVIVIDDDLSAKSAVAVFRLGAVDYLYKPLNMSFVMMQIERQLEQRRMLQQRQQYEEQQKPVEPPRDRARRLDPRTRPAALVLGRRHFKRINMELNTLLSHVRASFVGLVDADGNMVGAAGTLDDYDLQLLTQGLSIDHGAQRSLATMLSETKFHSSYFEGENNGVYIIEFGAPFTVSLAVICSSDTKAGMVWLYSKRTAAIIDAILQSIPQPKALPVL